MDSKVKNLLAPRIVRAYWRRKKRGNTPTDILVVKLGAKEL